MTFHIAERDVAIRSTSKDFGAWIDAALGEHRVADAGVEPEYSVVIDGGEDDPGRRGKRFHILYQGVGSIIRTLNLTTLGRSLVAELDARLLSSRTDAVYVHYGVAWTDDVTVLLPAWLVAYLSGTGRRLQRSGISLSASRWVAIDRATSEVLPERRFLDVPEGAFDGLSLPGSPEPERAVLRERRRIDAVVTYLEELDTIRTGSKATAVHHLGAASANLRAVGGDALETLATLAEGAHCFETGLGRAQQMLQALLDVVEHERAHVHAGEHA